MRPYVVVKLCVLLETPDVARHYSPGIPSAAKTICAGGTPCQAYPNRPVKTALAPLLSRIQPPTFACWMTGFIECVLEAPQMPVPRTLLDQIHHTSKRQLCAMQGVHPRDGSQQVFLTGLAHLDNLVPDQRRARHADCRDVEGEGGKSQHEIGCSTASWRQGETHELIAPVH
jgi:hypothetical protein